MFCPRLGCSKTTTTVLMCRLCTRRPWFSVPGTFEAEKSKTIETTNLLRLGLTNANTPDPKVSPCRNVTETLCSTNSWENLVLRVSSGYDHG